MYKDELKIIKQLDNGSLYADLSLIEEMFRYSDMRQGHLRIAYNKKGDVCGYLPAAYYYRTAQGDDVLSYIASMPNSPAVSPTYTPGAENILKNMIPPYFDSDVIADFPFIQQQMTASLYALPLKQYWLFLSASRKKDLRRKLKKTERLSIQAGNLEDIRLAWQWMQQIWEQRDGRFGSTPYDQYLETTLSWLKVLDQSQRVELKIDKYMLNNHLVGVNCCAIHRYNNQYHCDDYLTWYDQDKASGLGISSTINNFTHPKLVGHRYNLSNPGLYGNTQAGHQYKWDIIPEPLRLTQSVLDM